MAQSGFPPLKTTSNTHRGLLSTVILQMSKRPIDFHYPKESQNSGGDCSNSSLRSRIQRLLGIDDNDDRAMKIDKDSFPPPNIQLPKLKYGYREQPLDWSELVTIIQVQNDLARLARSESQQREYEIFKYYLRQYFKSILDFVLISKLGIPKQWNDDSKLWQAAGVTAGSSEENDGGSSSNRMVLIPNDFPYNMKSNIMHYILWSHGGSSNTISQNDIDEAICAIKTRFHLQAKVIYWINPPNLKSLPEIEHVHFLVQLPSRQTLLNG